MILSRTYIACLWALAFASLIAGADLADRRIRERASVQSLLLLPAQTLDDPQKAKILADLKSHPEVFSVRWLSPKELAQETSRVVSRELWPSLFAEEEAWLPWIAEVKFRDPIGEGEAVRKILGALEADSTWRLRLWDQAKMSRDAALVQRILRLSIPGGAIVLLLGALGLFFMPGDRTRPWAEFIINAVAAPALAAGLGAVANYSGIALDQRAWSLLLGASFILAGLAAPMLKMPKVNRNVDPGVRSR